MKIEISPILLKQYREEKISFEKLAELHNVSRPTLTKYFKENNLKTNKVLKREKINHHYFDQINTPTKAYILGYFVADGCITKKINKYSILKSVQFSCSYKDIEILKLIKKELNLDNKINKGKSYKIKGTNYISKPMNSLIFVSEKVFDRLNSFGYGERKSYLDYYLPNIDKNLLSYFILGFFDGDGSIVISEGKRNNGYNYKNIQFSLTSNSKIFLKDLKKYFDKSDIKSSIYEQRNSFGLRITNKKDIIKLRNLFYNSDLGLERKKEKFFKI